MKVILKANLIILIIACLLSLSNAALGCELVDQRTNSSGNVVQEVVDNDGEKIGMVRMRSNGKWEAIVLKQGALNDTFYSPEEAAEAICKALKQ